jgi:hypothetical protein
MSFFRALTRLFRRKLTRQADTYNARVLSDLGLKH